MEKDPGAPMQTSTIVSQISQEWVALVAQVRPDLVQLARVKAHTYKADSLPTGPNQMRNSSSLRPRWPPLQGDDAFRRITAAAKAALANSASTVAAAASPSTSEIATPPGRRTFSNGAVMNQGSGGAKPLQRQTYSFCTMRAANLKRPL
eukprot:CAMPEP_0180576810 /NCGR_PEP_ID=MMETSP1037_2-20121125/11613_1 /TAXON_ID=632150 /ORGANISM="Azadinium spinosum, Strain 3D9" /LENGTH=148 /DNA_ID=CAMNT_0022594543 /DNA_START=108 /DNA_END=555 /DNA_ORIENTATION=-